VPNLQQILDGLPPANSPAIRVDVIPGTIWRYSGGGYVVVQQLLEDVTGEPFAKHMQDAVLGRIGMTRSTYSQPLPQSRFAEVAMPYGPSGAPIKGGPHVYPEMGPAGLWTTPSDLARFAMELQGSLQGKSNRVISKSMTQQSLIGGLNGWGLGLHIGHGRQQAFFEHGGANEGYRCDLMAYNTGDGAVIMTNGDNGGDLMPELRRTIAHEYGWPDFQPIMHTVINVDPHRSELLVGRLTVIIVPAGNGHIVVDPTLIQQVRFRGGSTIYLGADDENDRTSLGGVDLYLDPLGVAARIQKLGRHPFEFYRKVGFVIVGVLPDANGFGKPDIFMAKRVQNGA
jgi:Beta-lactamase